MATIVTDEDFRRACRWLVDNGQLTVIGERFINAVERKVYDMTPNPTPPPEYPNQQIATEITPNTATLEAALDSALVEIGAQITNEAVQSGAKSQLQAIPNWASWTEAQVMTWFDTNVTNLLPAANLTAANTIMSNMATAQRAMARMLVALRNHEFPDLQE
jgi:hypothetical protein